ncbi:hypothetical protein [Janthinobacterium sp. SUN033]|uniref:hypothetical protein n=1 Tax=Janthinobacterium sp. SUN033 TaxID=3002439 RepID=UPI0025B10E38|nr:hypothetical protein [Janthinobacterium sp. SUN033]MDN2677675.1 hypothetical protein [Janthinobacterium sp. SUN033]
MMKNKTFRSRLDLTPAQRSVIDSMFAGPIEVLRCVANFSKPITSTQDASMFLLLHRADIAPYIVGNRDAVLEMLKELVVHLANDAPDHLTLTLHHWSLSANGSVRLPKLDLHDLHFDKHCERNELLEISGPCTAFLEHDGSDIFFSIAFQKNIPDPPRNSTPRAKNKHLAIVKVALPGKGSVNLKRCPVCHLPLSRDHWKEHANLLASIVLDKKPRASAADIGLGSGGSIWTVSGGLPSLGKRNH